MSAISHIDHIAIVVKSINEVKTFYEDALGLKITSIEDLPKRGIRTAFIAIGQSKIELIEPMHDHSEVSKFLEKRGPGIHHIALHTKNMADSEIQLKEHNRKLTYDVAQKGAHNTLVNFVHPNSTGGVLVEIVE